MISALISYPTKELINNTLRSHKIFLAIVGVKPQFMFLDTSTLLNSFLNIMQLKYIGYKSNFGKQSGSMVVSIKL